MNIQIKPLPNCHNIFLVSWEDAGQIKGGTATKAQLKALREIEKYGSF